MADCSLRWADQTRRYKSFLRLEKHLAPNSVAAYMRDLRDFTAFAVEQGVTPRFVTRSMVEEFMATLYDKQASRRTQARVLSGIKSFFNYLLLTEQIKATPADDVQTPKIPRRLPDVLTVDEVNSLIDAAAEDANNGVRNAAILETLYSLGLRVSELTALRFGDLFFEEGFVRVTGKGSKQRLVPAGDAVRQRIRAYVEVREQSGKDFVFLNNRGNALSRVMVFNIIKTSALRAGITKSISPHTLRHSFATHLLQGGASVRQVQEMLGHESILTTEIYTHIDMSHLRQTLRRAHPLADE